MSKIELNDGTQLDIKQDEDNDYQDYFVIDGQYYYFDDFDFFAENIIKSPDSLNKSGSVDAWVRDFKNIDGNVLRRVDTFNRTYNQAVTEFFFSYDGHFTVLY